MCPNRQDCRWQRAGATEEGGRGWYVRLLQRRFWGREPSGTVDNRALNTRAILGGSRVSRTEGEQQQQLQQQRRQQLQLQQRRQQLQLQQLLHERSSAMWIAAKEQFCLDLCVVEV